ncbi:DUF305 domain-containing protein [Nonomuraea cavernae]|uniref:DUF305 domain-containing protein n=1 Tax=Nonomuraea cavernae TaxID=2045107 RepID=UPI001CDA04C2|nr:DUF305 domain-containing protein [Nonomuraea cavernae]MCA2190467.1 DUF305 domain-containing protein [Nonomuraea cavernae]
MAAFVLAGCAEEPDQPSPIGTDAPVIVPQGPGTPARTATPGERIGQGDARPEAADVRFAEGMIPHHRQALEMTGLVAERTTDAGVRRFAEQIAMAQRPEISLMSSWLSALGRPIPAEHAHGPAGYGMATLEEMNALRAARGTAFDRMFLELMIRHHEGALKMAGEQLTGGRDPDMRRLAADVSSGQSIEIARMRRVLDALPG